MARATTASTSIAVDIANRMTEARMHSTAIAATAVDRSIESEGRRVTGMAELLGAGQRAGYQDESRPLPSGLPGIPCSVCTDRPRVWISGLDEIDLGRRPLA